MSEEQSRSFLTITKIEERNTHVHMWVHMVIHVCKSTLTKNLKLIEGLDNKIEISQELNKSRGEEP